MRLPLLEEAQAEGELAGEDVDTWRSRGGAVSRGTNLEAETPDGGGMPIEQVILQRGSTRRMVQERVPGNHLVWPLTAASRPAGIDVIGEGTLLDHYVNVHAVEGVDTGAYRLTDSGPDLIERKESLREQSAKLCLGQALGGDSACTVFHCARLDPLLVELGSRGYRAAQLEAGVVSGRLALCAFALGLGATGLTFFDDPVSRFFDTQSQPMLVTAVGVPATLPARSGEPGSPAVLGAR